MNIPHYDETKEYENKINEIRVEMGISLDKLCKVIGINKQQLWKITQGYEGPMYERGYERGSLKPWARKLVHALGYSIEKIFPREFCDITLKKPLLDCQIVPIVHSYGNQIPENISDIVSELFEIMTTVLSERDIEILDYHLYHDLTNQDIGDIFSISRERVRQIIKRSLNKVRKKYIIDQRRLNAKFHSR